MKGPYCSHRQCLSCDIFRPTTFFVLRPLLVLRQCLSCDKFCPTTSLVLRPSLSYNVLRPATSPRPTTVSVLRLFLYCRPKTTAVPRLLLFQDYYFFLRAYLHLALRHFLSNNSLLIAAKSSKPSLPFS